MTEAIEEELPPPFLYKKELFEIPQDKPWKNDCLGRKIYSEQLTSILSPVRQSMVMMLSAEYGMGKSTFLKCWKQQLENENVSVAVFNAWESDFSHDAFAAFVATISEQISPKNKVKEKFLKVAAKVGGAFIKNTPKFVAKVGAKALIGETGVEAIDNLESYEGDISGLTESIASDAFKIQNETSLAVKEFRNAFEKIIADDCDGRLFIFIDELDRCRPNYSVEVLERIKHLFSVKGVIFVLAVDRIQLIGSISGVYGSHIDAERYLRKFIDWEYELPLPSQNKYIKHLFYNIFTLNNIEFFSIGSDLETGENRAVQFISVLSEALQCSLRDLGQFFTYLNLIINSKPKKSTPTEIVLAAWFKHMMRGTCDKMIYWRASGVFTLSPVQELFDSIYYLDSSIWKELNCDKEEVIGFLILYFSQSADKQTDIQICVSAEFLAKLDKNPRHNIEKWLVRVLLVDSYSSKKTPNIVRGLRSINNLNI